MRPSRFFSWGWVLLLAPLLGAQLAVAPRGCHLPYHGAEANPLLIGRRNVGGGLDFYSRQKEIDLGRSVSDQINRQAKLVHDPIVTEYINRIAQNLVRNSDANVPFTVFVVHDDSLNAFALPGGFFYVNTGLILASRAEDELAGAMAHEIAHVAARHATRNMTKGTLLQLATIPLEIAAGPMAGGWGSVIVEQGANFVIPLQFTRFSRGAEREADWLGVQYLWKAGYDPNGMVKEFQHLLKLQVQRPGLMDRAFASHPQTPDRIATSECEIARVLPARPQYLVNTSDFQRVQHHLAKLLREHMAGFQLHPQRPQGAPQRKKPATVKPPVLKRPGSPAKPGSSPATPHPGI